MSEFREGDVVNITIIGARVVNSYPKRRGRLDGTFEDVGMMLVVSLDQAHKDDRSVAVNIATPGVTVEYALPRIEPGDILTDREGAVWFAQRYFADPDIRDDWEGCNEAGWRVVLVPLNGGPWGGGAGLRPEEANERYAPFRVVHHEDEREVDEP